MLTFTVFTSAADTCAGSAAASTSMEDLSHNPAAATTLFDPGPEGTNPATQELLARTPVSHDILQSYPALQSAPSCVSIGDALVAATDSSADATPHSPANVRVMQQVIAVLGGTLAGRIPAELDSQITAMMASYLRSGDINTPFVQDGLTVHYAESNGSPSASPPQASLDAGRVLAHLAADQQRYTTLKDAEDDYITGFLKTVTTLPGPSSEQNPDSVGAASLGFGEIQGLLADADEKAITRNSSATQGAEFTQSAYQDANVVVTQALKANQVLGPNPNAMSNVTTSFTTGEGLADARASAYGVGT